MKFRVAVVSAVTLALCAVLSAEEKTPKPPGQVTGPITAVDAAAKTITVKGAKAEVTLTIGEKTNLAKLVPVKPADLAQGQMVRVMGKVAKDQKSVEARMIVILPEGAKPRGKGVSKTGALGTIASTGDTLKLKTIDDAEITVQLVKEPRPTLVAKETKASFEDLKEGVRVRADTAEKERTRATRVTIMPPGMGKGKAKAKAKAE